MPEDGQQGMEQQEKEYIEVVSRLFKGSFSGEPLLTVKGWYAGGVPLPDIVEAYNRTIMALGRVNFHYTARIIEVWQEKQKEDGLTYSEREAQEKKKLLGERMGKPFSEKEVGYLTLLEELFKRPFTTPEILQVRQWVELEVPLTEIVRAFDETKIRTKKTAFSYIYVIIIGKAPANPLRHNGLSGGIPASGRSFPLFFPFTDSKQPLQSPPCGLRCPSAWSL